MIYSMKRRFGMLSIIALVGIATVVFLVWRQMVFVRGSAKTNGPLGGSNLRQSVQLAIANSEAAVKRRFTGGVGALLRMDNGTAFPAVAEVLHGSPAEIAGLRAGDLIIKVGNRATSGQPLNQVVEEIRGFALGHVTMTIQRSGSTNLTLAMPRSSWSALGMTNVYSPPPSNLPMRIVAAITNQPAR
jgi:membrane-associated protease RseP (regulator of RpoE activity)